MILQWSTKFNKYLGPFLLRHGLSIRYKLGGGVIRDNPTLDAFLFIPLAQKLISIEVQQETNEAITKSKKEPTAFEAWSESVFDRIFGKDPVVQHRPDSKATRTDTNPRLQVLEEYLRPVLVPNERWSDVTRWHFHHRFLKWARAEFLAAKYGPELQEALQAYPKLRSGPQVQKRMSRGNTLLSFLGGGGQRAQSDDDELILPNSNTVIKGFQMGKWNRRKDVDAGWRHLANITEHLNGKVMEIHSGMRVAMVPPEMDVTEVSLEELLEVAGGHVASLGAFNLLCEEADIYQFWTKEYIATLASYLMKRASAFDGETRIIDVGAGDGLLAQLLKQEFENKANRKGKAASGTGQSQKMGSSKVPSIIAVDNHSWNIPVPRGSVEKLDVRDAISKYASDESLQVIVLCSWMPMGEDWSRIFREHSVKEYILIGEYDDGNCGHNVETWGNFDYAVDDDKSALNAAEQPRIPAYQHDGFKRMDLKELSPFQFARFDSADSSSSKTVVFRRMA